MFVDFNKLNRMEQEYGKKTPEECDQIRKKLLEELKIECPTLGAFYKAINEQKIEGKTQSLEETVPSPMNLSRGFSGMLLTIERILEAPNNDGIKISIPIEKYKTIQMLKQVVNGMAAEVYFGQRNPIDDKGKINNLSLLFSNQFSKEIYS